MTNQNYTYPNLYEMDLHQLCEYADWLFEKRGYFVSEWQGETKAQQLCTCTCKILYRYWNDWDEYNKWYGRETCWRAARWIKKHCFRFKVEKNYYFTLMNLLRDTIQNIDKYEEVPAEGNIYEA